MWSWMHLGFRLKERHPDLTGSPCDAVVTACERSGFDHFGQLTRLRYNLLDFWFCKSMGRFRYLG